MRHRHAHRHTTILKTARGIFPLMLEEELLQASIETNLSMTATPRTTVIYTHWIESCIALWPTNDILLRHWQDQLAIAPDTAIVKQSGNSTKRPRGRMRGTLIKQLPPGRTSKGHLRVLFRQFKLHLDIQYPTTITTVARYACQG